MKPPRDPRPKRAADDGNESSPATPAPGPASEEEPLPGWTQEELDAAQPAPMPEVDDDDSDGDRPERPDDS